MKIIQLEPIHEFARKAAIAALAADKQGKFWGQVFLAVLRFCRWKTLEESESAGLRGDDQEEKELWGGRF